MIEFNILVINPGSTSDEVGYYEGEKEKLHTVMRYGTDQLEPYVNKRITEQFQFRKNFVLNEVKKQHPKQPIRKIAIRVSNFERLDPQQKTLAEFFK